MKIESEVARQSRYGEDAIEAFNTAVDNGQARLAMSILVDIVNAFADKIDELTEADAIIVNQDIKPAETVQEKREEAKPKAAKEEVKTASKEDSE